MWVTLGCLFLLAMAAANYRLGGHILWPPTLFCAIWGFTLLGIAIFHPLFYEVSGRTVGIYVLGALTFTLGGILAGRGPLRCPIGTSSRRPEISDAKIERVLKTAALFLVAVFPLFWGRLNTLSATTASVDLYSGVRSASLQISNTPGGTGISLVDNLPYLSTIFALIALNENARKGRGTLTGWCVVVLAVAYQVLTAARTGVFLIAVCAIVLAYFYRRRVKLAPVLAGILGFLALSVYNHTVLNKGVDKRSMSILDKSITVSEELLLHALGGAVAFDQVVENRDVIAHSHRVTYFFEHTLNILGAHLEEPSRHAQFLSVSPGTNTNVYTAYFCYYPDYGILGVIVCTTLIGWVVSSFYRRARAGGRVAAILYVVGVSCQIFTVIADEFFMSLNFWLKVAAVASAVYYFASAKETKPRSGPLPASLRERLSAQRLQRACP